MNTMRIDGCNVEQGDWVALSFSHEHGPMLGLVGRVTRIPPRSNTTISRFQVAIYSTGDLIWLTRGQIDRLAVIDGPFLGRDELESMLEEPPEPRMIQHKSIDDLDAGDLREVVAFGLARLEVELGRHPSDIAAELGREAAILIEQFGHEVPPPA